MPKPFLYVTCFAVALGGFLLPTVLRADVVVLKDGYVLKGTVRRQMTNFTDPLSGQQIETVKLNGFFLIDDAVRRTVFSFLQVADVQEKKAGPDDDQVKLGRRFIRLDHFRLPPGSTFGSATPFDNKGERTLTLETPNGKVELAQRITAITPDWIRVDALRYAWSAYYRTKELEPTQVRSWLLEHPDLKPTGDSMDVAKRFKIYQFLVQAGWYGLADAELNEILKALPEQKEKVEESRKALRQIMAARLVDELELGQKAGRYNWVRERTEGFPRNDIDARVLERVDVLKGQVATAQANVTRVQKLLQELPAKLEDGPHREGLTTAASAVLAEVNPDTVQRLDAFVEQAEQAERKRQAGQSPVAKPEELLSLAVSGWLLGNNSAESKVETAMKLWRARQFVLDYQRNPNQSQRIDTLQTYEKISPLAYDEMEQLIRMLPPPEPEPLTQRILSLDTKMPWTRRRPINYFVQLPPEYHHARSYPVLIGLHQVGERAQDMMTRLGNAAAQMGYIFVAPVWQTTTKPVYGYTADEHAAVTEVLRDLRRRFQVDSDRVFLFGWGEGGCMAYDVGLSHPDQFAGVITMGGRPRYFVRPYWRNGQYLPFYVVDGDLNSESAKDNRKQFESWVQRGYPSLYIEYKGRGSEHFEGEWPNIFDWMSRKKRAAAFPDLGKSGNGGPFGEEFQTMRTTDDRFYWISMEGINSRNVNEVGDWNSRVLGANVQGRIGEGNRINVTARGFKKVSLWLGQGMIDFGKNVNVTINMQQRLINRKVTPSLQTLLEDFQQRGDKQRLYWAKLDFTF